MAETISFSFTDAYNPGLITDTSSSIFVIMPMRITEPKVSPKKEIEDDSKEPAFT